MKVNSKHLDKDGIGKVVVTAEHDEDMYHLYNLIEPSDIVRSSAVRRVQSESSTGSVSSQRIKLNLTIQVIKTSFDSSSTSSVIDPSSSTSTSASTSTANQELTPENGIQNPTASSTDGGGPTLHLSGKVVEENQFVKMGAFHTLDVERNRTLSIEKNGGWDSVHLQRLNESADVGNSAEVGAVVMAEGTAIVTLLTSQMTLVRQRIEVSIPRKHKGIPSSSSSKALEKFFLQVYNSVLKLLELPSLKVIILASPGFTRDTFFDFLKQEAVKRNEKSLIGKNLNGRFLKVHCSSPHLHSLMEVLRSPEVSSQLKDTKFARETSLLTKFNKMLSTDEQRAWYGESHVFLAASRGAIGTLLISDGLFRSSDPQRRKKFVGLVEEVKKLNGEVAIFSSMHESGRQLNNLTGIAAILTYPLDVEMAEEEEKEEMEKKKTQESEQEQQQRIDEQRSLKGNPNLS